MIYIPEQIALRAENFSGRSWVLEQVVDWMDRGAERFLLVVGNPGTGKTALAAWLAGAGGAKAVEQVHSNWSAAHFCLAEDQRGSLNPARFSQSMARQLSELFDDYALAVLQYSAPSVNIYQYARENWGRIIGAQINTLVINTNFEDIYNRVVREPLDTVCRNNPGRRVFILVDALDEALTFGPVNIVTLLAGSDDLPKNVRFLLTSRNDIDVTKRFKGARRLNLSDSANADAADRDIRLYVESRLSGEDFSTKLTGTVTREEVINQLVRRAEGNFLYTKILLDEVASSKRSVTDISGLPTGLYGLYRDYLDRLIPESGQGRRRQWGKLFQPLLGCLSVAVPAGPLSALPKWLSQKFSAVSSTLSDVDQIIERTNDYGGSYRLYHRSMAEFLAAVDFKENGSTTLNYYHTPPTEQHGRIASYYLKNYGRDWQVCDAYGLRQIVNHLLAQLPDTQTPKAKAKLREAVYGVVLDRSFRLAQRNTLGDIQATLADLQAGLRLALENNEMVRALACVGAYRETIRGAGLARNIFEAVGQLDLERALRLADYYGSAPKPFGTWSRVLYLYLALEAAESSDVAAAQRAAATAQDLPWIYHTGVVCRALIMRAAHTLARGSAGQVVAQSWLAEMLPGEDSNLLLNKYELARPLTDVERDDLLGELEQHWAEMRIQTGEWKAEHPGAPGESFYDAEYIAYRAEELAKVLTKLAADPKGQALIDQSLEPVLANPYLQYRDIAASAVASAVLAAPDFSWVSARMQRILAATLDNEGITFTFDLPAILLAEADRRKLRAPELEAYLAQAEAGQDPWGTRVRAQSARAAALFRQGLKKEASEQLSAASGMLSGFSGYQTIHLLSLINRWAEFEQPNPASQLVHGRGKTLIEEASDQARHVRDYEFRQQRIDLVNNYSAWLQEGTPEIKAAQAKLATMREPDMRRAYKDFLSARWSRQPNWEAMKALVVMSLADGTTLDSVLGRLFGLCVRELSDKDLAEAVRICAADLTTGRP